jgi:hypothetical protein
MKNRLNFLVAVATMVLFMMGMGIMPVRAQFLYRDNHLFSGSITLSASDLAKGVYVYNLTANGVTLGTKRMINP